MAGTAWRRAASLILSGRGGGATDELAVLLVRRSAASRHLPAVSVFPGGLVEPCDFSADWRPLLTLRPVAPLLCAGADRPETFLERPPTGDELPAELGFRLAALRETFEETGVLLVRRLEAPERGGCVLPPPLAAQWRPRVHRDPAQLLQLCRQLAVVPDVWSLHEWSTWLTPLAVPGHRHDVAMFVASVPERPPCSADAAETEVVEWLGPAAALAAQAAGSSTLQPPQLYELGRLQRFADWTALDTFSRRRAARGLRRNFPVLYRSSEGTLFGVLPGDELYPAEPLLEGPRAPLQLALTMEQIMRARRMHRTIFAKGPHCTVTLPYGHVPPVMYPARQQDMLRGSPLADGGSDTERQPHSKL